MYSAERLETYACFRETLRVNGPAALHDSLTGLLARPYILRFIRQLIAEGTPFSLAILDLDNFKLVNDRYGHHIGDLLLSAVAETLEDCLGDAGFVGRIGGDEFLLVNLRDLSYDAAHRFFDGIYNGRQVFRRTYRLESVEVYATATVGCTAFPQDAGSYDALFQLADKTLYRGKVKGRNCFILYVEQKHRDIQIRSLAGQNLCETFRAMAEGFDCAGDYLVKLRRAFDPLRQGFFLQRLWLLDGGGTLRDVEDGGALGCAEFPAELRGAGLLALSGQQEMPRAGTALCEALRAAGMESALLVRVGREHEALGCLVFCPEKHTSRVWQDKECAAAFFLSRLLAEELRKDRSALS